MKDYLEQISCKFQVRSLLLPVSLGLKFMHYSVTDIMTQI
jgi:hypothetical protein